jgi:hypothetical protein
MEWYYRSKADGSKHGVADDKTLAEMAQNGELKPADLVWSEQTGGRWVQAQTVEGLFSKARSPVPTVAETPQKVLNEFEASKPARRRSPAFRRILWLLGVAAIGWGAFLVLREPSTPQVEPLSTQTSQPEQPKGSPSALQIPGQTSAPTLLVDSNSVEQEIINSNKIALLTGQFNTVMSNEDLDAASRLIVDIAKSSEETIKVQALSRRMIVLRQALARCAQLEDLLRTGKKIDAATAKEMVVLYDSRKKKGELVNMTKAMLVDSESLNSDTCLSLARVCMALDDSIQTKDALDNYVAHVKVSRDKLSEYLEVARMLYGQSDPLRSAELMRKYLLMEPSNPDIWLEYAAWKCVGGDPEAAIDALDQAIKCGDKTTKQKAQEDRRFASLKDKWAFRRLVKIRAAPEY